MRLFTEDDAHGARLLSRPWRWWITVLLVIVVAVVIATPVKGI